MRSTSTIEETKVREKAVEIVREDIFSNVTEWTEWTLEKASEGDAPFSWNDVENVYDEETDEHTDVVQWCVVSDWLYRQLRDVREVVLSTGTVCMWGRQGAGLALTDESCILTIAESTTE